MQTALRTDLYEFTMLDAALHAGTAQRRCVFEVFTRSLPEGRRYGVLAGTDRVLRAIDDFRFDESTIDYLASTGKLSSTVLEFLADYCFRGTVVGYREGDLYFPQSPVLQVEGSFAEAVLLETVILSILNHDSGVASAGARMVTAARGRPCIEMGSRRVHEGAAVAAARAAYLVGFASTSNVAAGFEFGIPVAGTSAHAFTLLFDAEADAFRAQLATQGPHTTVLVDTFDVEHAVRTAVELAGSELGGIRLDSGDLGAQASSIRALLDSLGATSTRITATSDLDEYRVEELAAAPVDGYGIGTKLVTGSGHPAPGFVYKLVEREGADGSMHPVSKRSANKATDGGRKLTRRIIRDGRAYGEVVAENPEELREMLVALAANGITEAEVHEMLVPLITDGSVLTETDPKHAVHDAREHHRTALSMLGIDPDEGPDGPVAIPTLTSVEEAAAFRIDA